jgi:hypothetical protein
MASQLTKQDLGTTWRKQRSHKVIEPYTPAPASVGAKADESMWSAAFIAFMVARSPSIRLHKPFRRKAVVKYMNYRFVSIPHGHPSQLAF